MTTKLTITFSREAFDALVAGADSASVVPARLVVEVSYTENAPAPASAPSAAGDGAAPERLPRSLRVERATPGDVVLDLGSPLDGTATLAVLRGDGSTAIAHELTLGGDAPTYAITAEDAQALIDAEPEPVATTVAHSVRDAQLVPIGTTRPDFKRSKLVYRAVNDAAELAAETPLGAAGFSADRSSAVQVLPDMVEGLTGLSWNQVNIGVDGRFRAVFDQPVDVATGEVTPSLGWAWWLNGERSAMGFVKDDVREPSRTVTVIPLPALLDSSPAGTASDGAGYDGLVVPANVTELELVSNPGVYTEDPGTFCRPFSNPERVISEKAFAVIARVQQPDISPLPSARLKSQQLLDLDPVSPPPTAPGDPRRNIADLRLSGRELAAAALLTARPPRRVPEPPETLVETQQMPSGRVEMSAELPIQWEDNIAQYQAATVALGHILEFRVRTRANGYSLGNVASTLTLAPRQTKRIQKIEFERFERAERDELTQQVDVVNDATTRERDYNDTVAAYLDEWATGSSRSGSAAAAGGIGFAVPPIVGGVGGGASTAWSSSTQQGTRNTGASEQQRLRDAIRRHGDALRRLQSTVVTEVTQSETVTGTTETLRNPNYGHSLTVIYYQILRHLAVSTEFAGVRECLFVPFAIKPFTLQRAYRWREAIQRYLRTPRYASALQHLRDVITQFQFSTLLPGTRAQQKLTYLRGSVFITLAVERPKDAADGKFDALRWTPISPFLGSPALGIWAKLAQQVEAQRDLIFQRDHAPTIAAKWVNSLQLGARGADVHADFTLASRYGFNQSVRVDFVVPASEATKLDRERLDTIQVKATSALPEGSVATVTRVSLRYGTASFERSVEGVAGADDLIEPGTAVPDPGAEIPFPLDAWDEVDERATIEHGVTEFLEHLNEHVEFYHKAIWWSMDRDRLLMMLDGFYVPGLNQVSLASVVDREPVAIIGNSLVYRVGGGTFIGYGKITTPAKLYAQYAGREPVQDPLLVSLPTDGLYAQTIMDECLALEEHEGSIDWVMNDAEPDLGTIDPSLMTSRRADAGAGLAPTTMPATIINLQNAPEAPAPSGLQGALGAVTTPNAFRDMAGLAGTQANAAAALQTAASLATNFGNQAAALKLADLAGKEKAREKANQQIAAVKGAQNKGLITDEEASAHANKILEQMHTSAPSTAPHQDPTINEAIKSVGETGGTVEASTAEGAVRVQFGADSSTITPDTEREDLLGSAGEDTPSGDTEEVHPEERWVVLVAGFNYPYPSVGTKTYATYARNRAALVYAAQAAKSVSALRFLLVNVGEGIAYVDDASKGTLDKSTSWRPVDQLTFAGSAETIPLRFRRIDATKDYPLAQFRYPIEVQNGLVTPPGWEDRPVFSIVHWYEILETFGRAAPGSIVEASILSHGYSWGP
ncbi:MAG TPA: hypothetical protein VL328_11595, partial [Gemmatimonadaceae bacterium]|nr:hypothetical protein [Gemmatimonadaceae bacterium]